MFTGIIESLGEIVSADKENSNLILTVKSDISSELKIDQSISHNGVCLTVTELHPDAHTVVAVDETLKKSSIGNLQKGDFVNLERCMIMNGRLDGHIVQGHVDGKGKCLSINDEDGSWIFTFSYDSSENVLVEKGSICINGVSLTCFDVTDEKFSIAIIPYTFEHTNFKKMKKNDEVNLEFDIIGKYVHKLINKTN
ncbi:riboflavin synthase [Marivirga harenae]|uniref:riboflavin synthase n=1 Tax=Marivirga harenae TaxID=2010992 RepID=UPI0026E08C34|nr:riboflavin synthase [Marivirga harenae]WKV10708.1 riboflavin synthase [Marivirga harenae]|tara:strand:- start:89290 stop:89877 length:588 start_codon:yes stop_codon:yes gene_type:complete